MPQHKQSTAETFWHRPLIRDPILFSCLAEKTKIVHISWCLVIGQVDIGQSHSMKHSSQLMDVPNEAVSRMTQLQMASSPSDFQGKRRQFLGRFLPVIYGERGPKMFMAFKLHHRIHGFPNGHVHCQSSGPHDSCTQVVVHDYCFWNSNQQILTTSKQHKPPPFAENQPSLVLWPSLPIITITNTYLSPLPNTTFLVKTSMRNARSHILHVWHPHNPSMVKQSQSHQTIYHCLPMIYPSSTKQFYHAPSNLIQHHQPWLMMFSWLATCDASMPRPCPPSRARAVLNVKSTCQLVHILFSGIHAFNFCLYISSCCCV